MARFTTRVQLNGYADEDDYTNLHAAMRSEGFSRFIENGDGKVYHMPHAEYNRVGDVTRDQVLKDAKTATSSVWSDFEILVTEGTRTWHGLKEATPAEVSAE